MKFTPVQTTSHGSLSHKCCFMETGSNDEVQWKEQNLNSQNVVASLLQMQSVVSSSLTWMQLVNLEIVRVLVKQKGLNDELCESFMNIADNHWYLKDTPQQKIEGCK